MKTIHHPIEGQPIPKFVVLLPNNNLPILIKPDKSILRLGKAIALYGWRKNVTTWGGGKSFHSNILNLPRRRVEEPLPKGALLRRTRILLP
jgi:hypothetical protein